VVAGVPVLTVCTGDVTTWVGYTLGIIINPHVMV